MKKKPNILLFAVVHFYNNFVRPSNLKLVDIWENNNEER